MITKRHLVMKYDIIYQESAMNYGKRKFKDKKTSLLKY